MIAHAFTSSLIHFFTGSLLHWFTGLSCDAESAMKIFLAVVAVIVVAALLVGDYKWRQWMAARRRERQ
jgi:hypothetical protein